MARHPRGSGLEGLMCNVNPIITSGVHLGKGTIISITLVGIGILPDYVVNPTITPYRTTLLPLQLCPND